MARAVSITTKQGFYERLIIRLLSQMERGSLHLSLPDGREFKLGNGNGIEANIEIRNPDFFKQCVLFGDVGFGESYVNGDWNTSNITNLIKWFLLNIDNAPGVSGSNKNPLLLNALNFVNKLSHFKRINNLKGSRKNISEHYDLNNAFFSLFLDPGMTYSSAYFRHENMSLEEAQLEKYDRLCRKLNLQPDDHVLEIGSGWGS
ncbi:MAG: class I SAM-dependent methyltransferase, partial [Flavobacteriia bacterium]|nr:class I SAM-dependent methyltransferase [Flavobacteriia bacterium]